MNELKRHLANVVRLGIKELWSLWRDPMMLALTPLVGTVLSVLARALGPPRQLSIRLHL